MAGDDQVSVPAAALDAIIAHARKDLPRECCGLLLGTDRRVEHAVPTRNALDSPTRFLVDPADHFAALRESRARGLAIVGAYHSHPASTPVPSERDVQEAAYDFIYLIVGLAEPDRPDVRAFEFRQGNFRPLQLVLSS
jgi:[CysO sulfur-carrier protein]-S-L-cysteine hydrolase